MAGVEVQVNKSTKIYLFIFPNNKYYCGLTSKTLNRRWQNGDGYIKCPLVYKAIKKYGWENIKKEIVIETLDRELAYEIEKEVISMLNLTNPSFGYNLHEGGKPTGSGKFLTEEGRRKISEANKNRKMSQYNKDKLREKNLGRKMSDITKKKISDTKKGNSPAPNRKKIYQLDFNDNIIAEYESITSAAIFINKPDGVTNIAKVCRKERKTAYGFKWRFIND